VRILWFLILPGAALLILAGTFATDLGFSVLVHDADGRTVARAALPDSGRFGIEYVHSYYEVSATEHFVAEEDGSFELVEISSPSEAVLDYYELEGRKEANEDFFSLAPGSPQRFDKLALIGTEKGERTLVVSGERFPLYEESPARHVTIRVEEDTPVTEARRMLTRSIGQELNADSRLREG
jgi:hypothetical protein